MALFKELTDVAEGSKIVVNMDVVRYLQRIKDMTSIYLGTTMQLRSRKPERIPDVEGALRCVAGYERFHQRAAGKLLRRSRNIHHWRAGSTWPL